MGWGTRLCFVSNEDVDDHENDYHDREEGDDQDGNEVDEDDSVKI